MADLILLEKKYTDAKKEVEMIEEQLAEISRKIGRAKVKSTSKHIPVVEPETSKWELLLSEMKWMANDFSREKATKKTLYTKAVKAVSNHLLAIKKKRDKEEGDIETCRIKSAQAMSRIIDRFWSQVEKVVVFQEKQRIEAEWRKQHSRQLDDLVDMAAKLLSDHSKDAQAIRRPSGVATKRVTLVKDPQTRELISLQEFKLRYPPKRRHKLHSNVIQEKNVNDMDSDNISEETTMFSDDDESDSARRTQKQRQKNNHAFKPKPAITSDSSALFKATANHAANAVEKGDSISTALQKKPTKAQAKNDDDDGSEFVEDENRSSDDESTLSREEQEGGDAKHEILAEVDALNREAEMSVEELRALYGADREISDDDDDEDDDDDDDEEDDDEESNNKSESSESSSSCENSSERRFKAENKAKRAALLAKKKSQLSGKSKNQTVDSAEPTASKSPTTDVHPTIDAPKRAKLLTQENQKFDMNNTNVSSTSSTTKNLLPSTDPARNNQQPILKDSLNITENKGKTRSKTQAKNDDDDGSEFVEDENRSSDDESTLSREEQEGGDAKHEILAEVDALNREAEMSVEELRALYGADREISDDDDEDDDDDDDDEEDEDDEEELENSNENNNDDVDMQDIPKGIKVFQKTLEEISEEPITQKDLVPVPQMIRADLRIYQREGLDWMATLHEKNLNGILADEMGLGKTLQTISFFAHLAEHLGEWGPHLVIVPTSVLMNWAAEFKKFLPSYDVLTYFGSVKERHAKRAGWNRPFSFNVCLTTYTLVLQDAPYFKRKNWHTMVLDEAQHIKSASSQKWQTLLTFSTQRRILLTGTPLQNNLMELWSLLHFLMPDVFSSHSDFKAWFAEPLTQAIEKSEVAKETGLVQRLHTLLRPFLLRRLKRHVEKQMPSKVEMILPCPLSKRQRFLYDEFISSKEVKAAMSGADYQGLMNCLIQLRKVCMHPDLFAPRAIKTPVSVTSLSTLDQAVQLRFPACVEGIVTHHASDADQPWNDARHPDKKWSRSSIFLTCLAHAEINGDLMAYESSLALTDAKGVGHSVHLFNSIASGAIVAEPSIKNYLTERYLPTSPNFKLRVAFKPEMHSIESQKVIARVNNLLLCRRAAHVANSIKSLDSASQIALHNMRPVFGGARLRAWLQNELASPYMRLQKTELSSPDYEWEFSYLYGWRVLPHTGPGSFFPTFLGLNHVRAPKDASCYLSTFRREIQSFLKPTPAESIARWRLGGFSNPLGIKDKFWDSGLLLGDAWHQLVCVSAKAIVNKRPFCRRKVGMGVEIERSSQKFAESRLVRDFMVRAMSPFHFFDARSLAVFPDRTALVKDCGKLQVLTKILEERRRGGHRCLIFTQMSNMLNVLESYINLQGYTYIRLDGTVKVEERQNLVENFNTNERVFLFISTTRVGGVGLNLTGADSVIFYDTDWNPASDRQAMDRCHRIGQTRDVKIYRLISEKTVEENVWRKQLQKRQLDDVVVDKGNFVDNSHQQQQQLANQSGSAAVTMDDLFQILTQMDSSTDIYRTQVLHEPYSPDAPQEVLEDEEDGKAKLFGKRGRKKANNDPENISGSQESTTEFERALIAAEDADDVEALKEVQKGNSLEEADAKEMEDAANDKSEALGDGVINGGVDRDSADSLNPASRSVGIKIAKQTIQIGEDKVAEVTPLVLFAMNTIKQLDPLNSRTMARFAAEVDGRTFDEWGGYEGWATLASEEDSKGGLKGRRGKKKLDDDGDKDTKRGGHIGKEEDEEEEEEEEEEDEEESQEDVEME